MTTSTRTLDVDRLIDDVRHLAELYPNRRNPYCRFFDVDDEIKPVCIMGVALHKQGFTADEINDMGYISIVIEVFAVDTPADMAEWLAACQSYADNGRGNMGPSPWGEAVAHADMKVPLSA